MLKILLLMTNAMIASVVPLAGFALPAPPETNQPCLEEPQTYAERVFEDAKRSVPIKYYPEITKVSLDLRNDAVISYPKSISTDRSRRLVLSSAFLQMVCELVRIEHLQGSRLPASNESVLEKCRPKEGSSFNSKKFADCAASVLPTNSNTVNANNAKIMTPGDKALQGYILDGLIRTILLHEIAHFALGHLEQKNPQLGDYRRFELEADLFATRWSVNSGNIPFGVSYLFSPLTKQEGAAGDDFHQTQKCRKSYFVFSSLAIGLRVLGMRLGLDGMVAAEDAVRISQTVDIASALESAASSFRDDNCPVEYGSSLKKLAGEIDKVNNVITKYWATKGDRNANSKQLVHDLLRLARELESAKGIVYYIIQSVRNDISSRATDIQYQRDILQLASEGKEELPTALLARISLDIGIGIQQGQNDTRALKATKLLPEGADTRINYSEHFLQVAIAMDDRLAEAFISLSVLDAIKGDCLKAAYHAQLAVERLSEASQSGQLARAMAATMWHVDQQKRCKEVGTIILEQYPGLREK